VTRLGLLTKGGLSKIPLSSLPTPISGIAGLTDAQDSSLRRLRLIHHPHWVLGTYSPLPRGCSTTIVASRCFVIQPPLSSLQRLSRTAPTGTHNQASLTATHAEKFVPWGWCAAPPPFHAEASTHRLLRRTDQPVQPSELPVER
jgi:hypothetical protein